MTPAWGVCVCVNGSCCGPGPGGPRGWPRQADFSHVVPSHKLPAFTSITFTGTSWVVANTGQGQGGNIQGNFWRSASCEALRFFLLSRIEILNYNSNFLQNGGWGSDLSYKVNRCLARYSPRATTTIQPTYRFLREGVKLLVPSYQGTNETPLLCWKHWPVRLQWAAREENVQFWIKNLDIWSQKLILCFEIAIFVNRAYHQYTRSYNFPIHITPKKFSVSELWVIFRGLHRFLAISGHSHFDCISTLNFGRFSTWLGRTVQAIMIMTLNNNWRTKKSPPTLPPVAVVGLDKKFWKMLRNCIYESQFWAKLS